MDTLRHSCAHLLAAAVMELWPNTKRTIGPAIENGFYYDFDFGDIKISEADFAKIEQKMHELVKHWKDFRRKEVTKEEALSHNAENQYKKELIEEFSDDGKHLTIYTSGNFMDLCRGGHCEHPDKELKYFKLLSVAGAYWRGNEKNPMLTRIYGTCFPSKQELDDFVKRQEEAKKYDHKKLGRELDLFLMSPSVGSGYPLYMPKGFIVKRELERWIMTEKEKRGYQFVWTPAVAKSDLYKQSGHWQKYDAMMNPMTLEDEEFVVKPMNCPHHFQIYNARARSYRELPLRIAENATVYRFEKAGEINGLLRVRALTQDDSHIFVRHNQIAEEIDRILDLAVYVYKTFGFSDYQARISIRDPKHPDKYLGDPSNWDKAEKALIDAVAVRKLDYFVGEGEAAFYGPKIDIVVKDALGRQWQLTTCQLDFVQPENFNLHYIDELGKEERPAVLHVAVLGSVDRFMAILIEHFKGVLPTFLAPIQIAILPIAERHNEYGKKVSEQLENNGFRVYLDTNHESLQKKIRNFTLQKVPYQAIIGDKEMEHNTISIRTQKGEDLKDMTIDALSSRVNLEIERKS